MGLCLSSSYAEEPVRPPVQTYVVQQQQVAPEPSAPRLSYSQPYPNYVPTSQYTYAVPYAQSQGQSYPVKQQSINEDPQPVTYAQYPQYTPTMYPPPQTTMYVQQPVYRQPVQQTNNTTMSMAGGFILGSVLADIMDDD